VEFTIEVKERSGEIKKLFSNYIDPKHNAEERRWCAAEIDLSRYRGEDVTLLFSTDPGPQGNTAFDWAAWSDFRFDGDPRESPLPFNLLYDAEAKLYEYPDVLPRAAVYYDAALAAGDAAVLQKLTNPSVDVFRTVVLDSSQLTTSEIRTAGDLSRGAAKPVEPALIRSYGAQKVEIEASLDRSGILVLNDSDYPGWRVSVDGKPDKWFTANYLFRAVLLLPGKHVVRFDYRPASFYRGVALTLLTIGVLTAFGVRRLRLRPALL
jgi:hypothetical protein